ncbi:MAG: DciA family protein [Parcubacteria group bacterium]|jgi:hypothetical protein
MKGIKSYIQKKKKNAQAIRKENISVDDQTIMHLFSRAVREEYGRQGEKNIVPKLYKNGLIFISIHNAIWAQEIWLRRDFFVEALNEKIGRKVVRGIKIAT